MCLSKIPRQRLSHTKPPRILGYKAIIQIQKKVREKRTIKVFGGGKRDRTADLLNAIQALSQLSYTPNGYERIYIPSISSCQELFSSFSISSSPALIYSLTKE